MSYFNDNLAEVIDFRERTVKHVETTDERKRYETRKRRDKQFEKELSSSYRKAILAVYAICAFVALSGIIIFAGVAAGFYYIWDHYMTSDIYHLCAYYVIFGFIPNMLIYNVTEYVIGLTFTNLIDNCKKNYHKFKENYYLKEER